MSDEVKEGLNAALTAAMERWGEAPPAEKAEQLALLPLPLDRNEAETAADRRGPGRPVGAKNKRTEAWTDYLLANYRSPLEALAQIVAERVDVLCMRLDCTPLEAFKLQIQAAKELAPYLHQKQPVAVNLSGAPAVSLTIIEGAPGAALQGQQGDGSLVIEGVVVDQENDEKSDG